MTVDQTKNVDTKEETNNDFEIKKKTEETQENLKNTKPKDAQKTTEGVVDKIKTHHTQELINDILENGIATLSNNTMTVEQLKNDIETNGISTKTQEKMWNTIAQLIEINPHSTKETKEIAQNLKNTKRKEIKWKNRMEDLYNTLQKTWIAPETSDKTKRETGAIMIVWLLKNYEKNGDEINNIAKKIKIKHESFTSNEIQAAFGGETLITKEKQTENLKTRIKNSTILSETEKAEMTVKILNKPILRIPKLGTETPQEMADVLTYLSDILPERIDTTTINKHIEELRNNTITEDNQASYNNILHIFATGERLSKEKIINQKEQRTQTENLKKTQENFEKAKTPSQKLKVLEDAINQTNEAIGKPSLDKAFSALMSGDFKEAIKEISNLLKYVLGFISGKTIDANEKLFNHKKLDFTNTSILDLLGSGTHYEEKDETGKIKLDKQGKPIIKEKTTEKKEEEYGDIKKYFTKDGKLKEAEILKNEDCLYTKIYKKKQKAWLTEKIMYTSAFTKLKDTLYFKRKLANEKKDGEKLQRDTEIDNPDTQSVNEWEEARKDMTKEVKNYRSKENQEKRLLANVKPGDLIFFVGGNTLKDGKVENNKINNALEVAWGPGNHVGIVGEDGRTLIHSTMKKYDTGRSGGATVDLIEELNSRPNTWLVIGHIDGMDGKAFAQKAAELAPNVKYDHTEAITSIKQKYGADLSGENKARKDYFTDRYNCASFVDYVAEQTPRPTEPKAQEWEQQKNEKTEKTPANYGDLVPATWLPSELMEKATLDYTMERQG